MKALIVVPTYNESENIRKFLPAVFDAAGDADCSVLVVDDASPDGTGDLVEAMQQDYAGRLFLMRRAGKNGLATAYIDGFRWGMERGFEAFLEMDADFSHNPAYLPEMFRWIREFDVVIGSRNIPGGGVENWSLLRKAISKGGSLYSRIVLGCPIRDLTGGFNFWRRDALDKIRLDTVISRGYSFQIELKYKAWRAGCSVREFPIIFPDRVAGKSKMSKKIFLEALINIWKIRFDGSRS